MPTITFDVASRQALGHFDLVEIFGSVVVDRRPKQAAQIAHFIGRRQLRRMRADIRQLLPRFGRKIRLETLRQHDLPRYCLKIERRRTSIVHHAQKANMNSRFPSCASVPPVVRPLILAANPLIRKERE